MSRSERSETVRETVHDQPAPARGDGTAPSDAVGTPREGAVEPPARDASVPIENEAVATERRANGAVGDGAWAHPRATSGSGAPATVVGGGRVGRRLAGRLLPDRQVHYVDDDPAAVERAGRRHEATYVPDLADRDALAAVVDRESVVVVATPRDATNLLVAQHCRAVGVRRVVVVVTDPQTYDAYPPGIERVCATTALADAVAVALADGPAGD